MDYEFQNQAYRQTQSAGSSPMSNGVQAPQGAMYIDLSDTSSPDAMAYATPHSYGLANGQSLSGTPHSEKRRRILHGDSPSSSSVQPHPPYWPQTDRGSSGASLEPNLMLSNVPSFDQLSIHPQTTHLVRSLSSSAAPARIQNMIMNVDTTSMPMSSMEYSRSLMARQQQQAMVNHPSPQHAMSINSSPANIPIASIEDDDDDDLIVDEEMTNKNICLGMVKTDIVAIKTIDLIKDEGYEAVQVLNEGRRDKTGNYSFVVSSRTAPRRFFGWLPFEDTKFLGPLADAGMIWWDAVIPRNKSNQHRTPVFIILYSQPNNMKQVGLNLRHHNVHLEEPPFFNPSCRYQNPNPNVSNTTNNRNKYSAYNSFESNAQVMVDQTKREISELLDSIPSTFTGKKQPSQPTVYTDENGTIILEDDDIGNVQDIEDDDEELDESKRHIEGLKVALMKHQVRGVQWMIDREANKSSNGGILADDMGLGKTIQTMGLLLSTLNECENTNALERNGSSRPTKNKKITLIVTPLALIQQWANEIRSKTQDGRIKVLVHHGQSRSRDATSFLHYDVIITTYQVVASDYPAIEKGRKKKQVINDMNFDTRSESSVSSSKKRRNGEDAAEDEQSSTVSSPGFGMLDYTGLPDEHSSGLLPSNGYGPLFQVKWHRIVLDEAQQIKNRNTRASLSCTGLQASKRWCLTGTPLQNNVDELFSLLRFLRIQPLCNYNHFKTTISAPIQNGQSQTAMARLKAVLMAIMLRRTKSILKDENLNAVEDAGPSNSTSRATSPSASGGADVSSPAASVDSGQSTGRDTDGPLSTKLSLKLPERDKKDVFLDFSPKERELYDMLTMKTRSTVEKIFKSGKDDKNYLNMLCMLLRLRQACNHPQLVLKSMGADADALELETTSMKSINNNRREAKEAGEALARRALMAKMAVDLGWGGVAEPGMSVFDKNLPGKRTCELCSRALFNNNSDASSPFCWECAEQVIKCAQPATQMAESTDNFEDSTQSFVTSSKISKIVEILDESRRTAPTEKTIVFSQFTAMLDLIEEPLKKCGFKYCRYDGSMTNQLREKSLMALKTDPETTVMLISLKCGSLGLNLTAANRVILTDVWWNPALEEQAIDRVHRIGQTLRVQVVRLLVNDTIEQKVVALQQKKARIIHGALGDGAIQSTKLTTQEIRKLFDL
ncbi:hypothetical protein VKS41_009118 [Umbelopsis sp. WA50703]